MLCKTENTRFTENNNSSNRNRANHFQVYQKSGIQGSTGQSDDILKISDRTDPIAIYVKNLRNRTKGEFVEIQELSFLRNFSKASLSTSGFHGSKPGSGPDSSENSGRNRQKFQTSERTRALIFLETSDQPISPG